MALNWFLSIPPEKPTKYGCFDRRRPLHNHAATSTFEPARSGTSSGGTPLQIVRSCTGWLLAQVAHRFDVVAVGISYETAVVVGVVLGPQSRRVEHLGTGFFGCLKECVYAGSVG